MKIEIYTDGSCLGNPGPGGYAYVIFYNNKEISRGQGSSRHSTNQREELMAIIEALKSLQKDVFTKKYDISIFTDSQYCKNIATKWINNWYNNNWKNSSGKQIKNIDLVKQLYQILQIHKNIKWNWVKGHSIENEKNNLVDSLAVEAAKKQL
jgi:ribonuclease HI